VIEKTKLTTSNSFKNYNHTDKWTEQETKKFYRALELFGTDFSMIAQLFPMRNRMQIKNKFLKEEKLYSDKVDAVFRKKDKSALKLFVKVDKFKELYDLNMDLKSISNGQMPLALTNATITDKLLKHEEIGNNVSLVKHNNDTVACRQRDRSESFGTSVIDKEIISDLSALFKNDKPKDIFANKL